MGHSSKEHFSSSIYGAASPRVVADGEPVPHGGGTYMVGKPYTIAGKTYYPSEKRYAAVGLASWYGEAFHGRRTANGEVYDSDSISAAHPTMPLPSYARVTNLRNNYSMVVRVNDRGPFTAGRIMDVSRKTAEVLDFHLRGTTPVKIEYIGAASLSGSDDEKLLATLRKDNPASLGVAERIPVEDTTSRAATAAVRGALRLAGSEVEMADAAGPIPLPPARPENLAAGRGVPVASR
ncbi:MAG TPA: septal ring lytic transglycosylase RlpA family protein [Methylocella sp.]|nr:septal ring lytic transglycosylase RlpA family protein [Methylocella sp.]